MSVNGGFKNLFNQKLDPLLVYSNPVAYHMLKKEDLFARYAILGMQFI